MVAASFCSIQSWTSRGGDETFARWKRASHLTIVLEGDLNMAVLVPHHGRQALGGQFNGTRDAFPKYRCAET